MKLDTATHRAVAQNFGGHTAEASALLEAATIHDGSAAEARLQRCAAFAAKGSMEKLRYYVEMLKTDYRDVIVAGEANGA